MTNLHFSPELLRVLNWLLGDGADAGDDSNPEGPLLPSCMLGLAALNFPLRRPEFWQLAIRRAAKRLLRAQCLPHEHLEKMLRRMT